MARCYVSVHPAAQAREDVRRLGAELGHVGVVRVQVAAGVDPAAESLQGTRHGGHQGSFIQAVGSPGRFGGIHHELGAGEACVVGRVLGRHAP